MHEKGDFEIDENSRRDKFAGKPFREIVRYYVRTQSVGEIANQLADLLDRMEGTSRTIAEWAAVGFATFAKERAFWKRNCMEVADEIRSTSSAYFQRLGVVPSEEVLLDIVQVVVLSLAYTEKSNKTLDKRSIIRKTL